MGKKSTKNKRKSELRIIFFIILVAAAMFIISTYAWFSTQRNVSITNLSGTVEVAEGLEISLNAKEWFNEIVLNDEVTIKSIKKTNAFSHLIDFIISKRKKGKKLEEENKKGKSL